MTPWEFTERVESFTRRHDHAIAEQSYFTWLQLCAAGEKIDSPDDINPYKGEKKSTRRTKRQRTAELKKLQAIFPQYKIGDQS